MAFGAALWEVLVVEFADFLSRLTVRKVLEFVAIAVLVMAFAQTAPIELGLLFAGDTLMYLEFVLIVRLAAGRDHFAHMLRLAMQLARLALRMLRAVISQPVVRISRLRERRTLARAAKPPNASDRSGDGGGFAIARGMLAAA